MDSFLIQAGEMIYLLKAAGVSLPATMTAEEFGLPVLSPTAAPSEDGAAKQGLVNVLANPQVVIRIWCIESEVGPSVVWYYWDGDSAVRVRKTDSGDFELARLEDLEALRLAVKSALDIRPVPEDENIYAILSREDLLEARDLADVWEEVPALDILEADGLDKTAAEELFDAASDPEWRTQINLTGIRPEGNIERVVRVAQGAETAWMATPVDPQIAQIRVETVNKGKLESLMWEYWDEVNF